jgi:DNA-binding MarR family transcriptional regulator
MSAAEIYDGAASLFEPGGPLSDAEMERIKTDPRFPAAMRAFAQGMISIYRGNRLLNALINDRGRMVIGYLALYLHEGGAPDGRGTGFGVGQLKALCAAIGIASPGRTAAMLALMRVSGYIESARGADDRRRHILVPTERLREVHRERWRCMADAVRQVRPETAAAFDIGNPEFEAAYVRHSADYYIQGMRIIDIAPELQLFTDRNAGMMILFSLLLSGEPGDTIPPRRPVPISISALASRFGVSRVHVRTLLREAEAAGLIERTENHLTFKPTLIAGCINFAATAILYVGYCAVQAAADAKAAT